MIELLAGMAIVVAALVVAYLVGLVVSRLSDLPTEPRNVPSNIFIGVGALFFLSVILFIAHTIGFAILH